MNFEDIGSILASLSEEDMENLNAAAQQILGGEKSGSRAEPSNTANGIDPDTLSRLMRIIPLLHSGGESDRARLICALKPLLSPSRQKKADEALQIMRLIEILPMLNDFM